MATYEIYEQYEGENQHPEFQAAQIIGENVRFSLKEQMIGQFAYYIRAVADGGTTYWSPQLFFETQCDPNLEIVNLQAHPAVQWSGSND